MDKEFIIDRLSVLPENLQIQVLDYIEFLIDRYRELTNVDTEEGKEPSPELKAFLLERIAEHERNPKGAITWEEMVEELNKQYGYNIPTT